MILADDRMNRRVCHVSSVLELAVSDEIKDITRELPRPTAWGCHDSEQFGPDLDYRRGRAVGRLVRARDPQNGIEFARSADQQ